MGESPENFDDLIEPVEEVEEVIEDKKGKKGKVDTANKGGYSDGELDYMK